MSSDHLAYGIDEVYLHKSLDLSLLEKLQQRASLTLDGSSSLIRKYAAYDMVLISYRPPNRDMIIKFLKHLSQSPHKEQYYESNVLLNPDDLFDAVKTRSFTLVTGSVISEEQS
jgi:hypothetical protein